MHPMRTFRNLDMTQDPAYIYTVHAGFSAAHIQLSTDGVYLALPLKHSIIGVWNLQEMATQPLELEGHRKRITSLALGNGSFPKLLCSAAEDYVIVWDIQHARQKAEKKEQIRGKIIGTTLGYIQYCSFSPDDKLVAVCCDTDVLILQLNTQSQIATVEGHTARLTSAQFCPHYVSTLVTISEDRTFKIWNLDDFSLIYQSPILTASPFISMAMNLSQPQVAIGTADGQVRVFDLTDGNGFRQLHHLDIGKIVHKKLDSKPDISTTSPGPVTISSKPRWQQESQSDLPCPEQDTDDMAEMGYSVLGLHFTYVTQESADSLLTSSKPALLQHKNTVVKDLLDRSPMLVVATTGALLQINAKTLELCKYIDLQEPIKCVANDNSVTVSAAGSAYFCQGVDPSQVWCIVCGNFERVVHVLQWRHATPVDHVSSILSISAKSQVSGLSTLMQACGDSLEDDIKTDGLTVLSNVALLDDSPLRAEMVFKQKEETKGSKLKGGTKGVSTPNKKTSLIKDNQPLTFHSKVKSSGYTSAPRTTMFKPKTNVPKSASSPGKTQKSSLLEGKVMGKQYPMDCDPPSVVSSKLNAAERATPVYSVKFSDDGQNLACGLANKSAQVFSMPLNGKGSSYVGHNHSITCVNWSHDGNWIITSSDDKTACIWGKGRADPTLTFSHTINNFHTDKEGQKPSKENTEFPKEVKFARFYYMDKFILLTSGGSLYMYKFNLDPTKQDIKRYLSMSKYKQVLHHSMEAQQITALSSVNGFYSYLVFYAGTNKSLEIFDMNVSKVVRSLPDIHTKSAHVICQNEGSTFTSHPADAYDLFVTAAVGDCIKLWDVRTNRCVRRYEGHMNRMYSCGVDLSPCGRYIGTGSEDKSAYVFDIRTGTYCKKLTDHTDVVADIAFHPKYAQMVTCSLDGKLVLYSDKSVR